MGVPSPAAMNGRVLGPACAPTAPNHTEGGIVVKLEVRDSKWKGSQTTPVQGPRGYAHFCPCGTRFLVSAPFTSNWDATLERAIEDHEWTAHTIP